MTIDFACKKFDLYDVVRCSFGLTKTEMRILLYLLNNSKSKFVQTSDISKSLKIDKSTVQRAFKKMYSIGLLYRSQRNLSPGGYVYEYHLKSRSEISEKVMAVISSWTERVKNEMNNL